VSVNQQTGEVADEATFPGTDVALVPLNLSTLSEDEIVQLIPTPVQAAGALLRARELAQRVPDALDTRRRALKTAERELTIAVALGAQTLLTEYPRMPMTERRDLARATDSRVQAAQEAVDTAWLLLEYTRDWDRAIGRDIDILRSLNANLRGEHR
jgi:hypothetical protein